MLLNLSKIIFLNVAIYINENPLNFLLLYSDVKYSISIPKTLYLQHSSIAYYNYYSFSINIKSILISSKFDFM